MVWDKLKQHLATLLRLSLCDYQLSVLSLVKLSLSVSRSKNGLLTECFVAKIPKLRAKRHPTQEYTGYL